MTDVMIGGKRCLLFDVGKPEVLLIQTLGRHEVKGIADEVEMIRRQTNVPFAMAAFDIADWELELMPWHDPEVTRRKDVGEGAGKTMQYVSNELLPVLRERYGQQPVVLGGYSLGGLFSLWAASLMGEFAAVSACSPSLWIRDWLAFAREHPLKTSFAYISLGKRENIM